MVESFLSILAYAALITVAVLTGVTALAFIGADLRWWFDQRPLTPRPVRADGDPHRPLTPAPPTLVAATGSFVVGGGSGPEPHHVADRPNDASHDMPSSDRGSELDGPAAAADDLDTAHEHPEPDLDWRAHVASGPTDDPISLHHHLALLGSDDFGVRVPAADREEFADAACQLFDDFGTGLATTMAANVAGAVPDPSTAFAERWYPYLWLRHCAGRTDRRRLSAAGHLALRHGRVLLGDDPASVDPTPADDEEEARIINHFLLEAEADGDDTLRALFTDNFAYMRAEELDKLARSESVEQFASALRHVVDMVGGNG